MMALFKGDNYDYNKWRITRLYEESNRRYIRFRKLLCIRLIYKSYYQYDSSTFFIRDRVRQSLFVFKKKIEKRREIKER